MNYDFNQAEEKLKEKPKPFRLERNLIPRRIAQFLQAGGHLYQ